MKMRNKLILKIGAIAIFSSLALSCSDDDTDSSGPDTSVVLFEGETKYFAALETDAVAYNDVISSAENLTSSEISFVGNGFEQNTFGTYLQNETAIFSFIGETNTTITKYELVGEVLIEITPALTVPGDHSVYPYAIIDESTMIVVASPLLDVGNKNIYIIDTDTMTVSNSLENIAIGDLDTDFSFATDVKVVGDNIFISYILTDSTTYQTTNSDEARIAVYSYPDLEFVKLIEDDRAPNIGRYLSENGLQVTEDGDLYTVSTSSVACGFAPAPATNSGILRINNGETDFDTDFHIDFEELSGGYKLNDMYYVGNGKAVVRILQEDETLLNEEGTALQYYWGSYYPLSPTPLLSLGIVDLENETFQLVTGAPLGGGGWHSASLVEDGKLYLGVSNSEETGVYIIDPETATATQGASNTGTYIKDLFALETTEE